MQKLANSLELEVNWQKIPMLPFAKKIYHLSGIIRNKNIEIFPTKFSRSQKRIVAQIPLTFINPVTFTASRKRLGYNFLKIIKHDIITAHDPILDRKIIFRSNHLSFAEMVLQYEEIQDKLDTLFSYKFNSGILTLGQASIFYYELIGFLTETRRKRFQIAIDLMCDLLDVLYFYNKRIQ